MLRTGALQGVTKSSKSARGRSHARSHLSTMSFGRPPSISGGFQVNPPDRGSFPLDHDGSHPLTLTPHPRATR